VRLEMEKKPTIEAATVADIAKAIGAIRSFGPSSFAILSARDGSYIQVAGGGQTCAVEVRDAASGRHYRAHQTTQHPVFPDGTALMFGGGELILLGNEWFTSSQAVQLVLEFQQGQLLPTSASGWRDVTSTIFGKV
jgi:hypothetical protein